MIVALESKFAETDPAEAQATMPCFARLMQRFCSYSAALPRGFVADHIEDAWRLDVEPCFGS